MGSSVGSFFYDFASLRDALKRERFDIIYEAGYTSIVPAYIWFNVKNIRHPVFTTNMDGLEYKRTKFNSMGCGSSSFGKTDDCEAQSLLDSRQHGTFMTITKRSMARRASFAYGADIHEDYNPEFLKEFGNLGEWLLFAGGSSGTRKQYSNGN